MLICVSGFKNAGKDSVGNILVEKHGFVRAAFADMLKEAVCVQFGITRGQIEEWKNDEDVRVVIEKKIPWPEPGTTGWVVQTEFTFRRFLQNTGNDFRKVFGEDFWINVLDPYLEHLEGKDVVITDGRYFNERQAIIGRGGLVIWVNRPGIESDGHEGEQLPNPEQIYMYLENSGTLQDLESTVEIFLDTISIDANS